MRSKVHLGKSLCVFERIVADHQGGVLLTVAFKGNGVDLVVACKCVVLDADDVILGDDRRLLHHRGNFVLCRNVYEVVALAADMLRLTDHDFGQLRRAVVVLQAIGIAARQDVDVAAIAVDKLRVKVLCRFIKVEV